LIGLLFLPRSAHFAVSAILLKVVVRLLIRFWCLRFLFSKRSNLSDENTELFIRDRLSFREFLGLTLAGKVPDAHTIWNFGELLKEQDIRNHPLTPLQFFCNSIKSRIRCRIEHIFGTQKKRMGYEILRTIGLKRARFWTSMRNLVNNMLHWNGKTRDTTHKSCVCFWKSMKKTRC
jgi:hypothetical protein